MGACSLGVARRSVEAAEGARLRGQMLLASVARRR